MGIGRLFLKILTLGFGGKKRDPAEAALRAKIAKKEEEKERAKQEKMEKIKEQLTKK